MRLLVISHTPHYRRPDGRIVGWSPTIRELNYLTEVFQEIYHIAPLYSSPPPLSASEYGSNIVFVPIEVTGGKTFIDKLDIVYKSRNTIKIVKQYLARVDYFQFRAPTGMGVYMIPWLSLRSGKPGWFKYAGNWVAEDMPLSYRLQRYLLKNIFTKRPVTINGMWEDQPKHIFSFENPALTNEEIALGNMTSTIKSFEGKLTLLFVGRVEREKGFHLLLEMLAHCDGEVFKELIVIGEGDDYPDFTDVKSSIPIRWVGGIPRDRINDYYACTHFLILPSKSEGFPKVVAEAAAFGCLPAVFNISAMGQYIDDTNGLIFKSDDPEKMAFSLTEICEDRINLKDRSIRAGKIAGKFTYSYYNRRIQEILSLPKS